MTLREVLDAARDGVAGVVDGVEGAPGRVGELGLDAAVSDWVISGVLLGVLLLVALFAIASVWGVFSAAGEERRRAEAALAPENRPFYKKDDEDDTNDPA